MSASSPTRYALVIACIVVSLFLASFLSDYHNILKFTSPTPVNPIEFTLGHGQTSADDGLVHQVKSSDQIFVHEAKKRSTVEGGAYVFLALGAQAVQMNCPAAIESLVRYGGWDGDVFMITDRKDCFNEKEIVKNAGMAADKMHIVGVDEDFTEWHGINMFRKDETASARLNRVRSFEMKTRLFELIPDERIQTIAYADCDILFGVDGCAADFMNAGLSWNEAKMKFTRLFYDETGTFNGGVHLGTMVLHREHSKEGLRLWREQMHLHENKGDNHAYSSKYLAVLDAIRKNGSNVFIPTKESVLGHKSALVLGNTSDPVVTHPMSPGLLVRKGAPDISTQSHWFEKFFDPDNIGLFCLNHISKARCHSGGRNEVQKFVDRFALRTYKHSGLFYGERSPYPYCVSYFLRPLLYGWFPFSSLPFCPKLEALL